MGQHQIAVVFREVRAHQIFRKLCSALHGNADGTLLIQHHKIRNVGEAMILRHLIVHGRAGPLSAVGRIVFHNGAVHLMHQVGDQLRIQIVAGRRLSRGQLHRDVFSGKLHAQRLICGYHGLRRDFRSEIDGGRRILRLMLQRGKGDHFPAVGGDALSVPGLR